MPLSALGPFSPAFNRFHRHFTSVTGISPFPTAELLLSLAKLLMRVELWASARPVWSAVGSCRVVMQGMQSGEYAHPGGWGGMPHWVDTAVFRYCVSTGPAAVARRGWLSVLVP